MKLGEIKLEALVLMNVINESKFEVNKINEYLNESKYKKYLLNMNHSISQAVDIINNRNVLKEKICNLTDLEYIQESCYITLSLEQIKDYKKIKKVVSFDSDIIQLKYQVISNILIVFSTQNLSNIKIVYYPKIVFFENLNDNDELPIDNDLARIIPYYIKYDLYQEDEPNLSLIAKSNFDSLLAEFQVIENDEESEIEKFFEV